ncbi:hypothetical protein F441_10532 [Phytophthora nicotianae CJ01A1]|uniref:Uncharacterized protein n=1 Tax=Phytophthora nicotianae CJ01A1 TaxID=1317063 RepID=W2WY42_PHYNI|nr:hypothetical protein F441_10532 [Phytophthora nicotianae CJ01A1]
MTTTPKGSDGEQETFFQVNEPTGSSLLQDDARVESTASRQTASKFRTTAAGSDFMSVLCVSLECSFLPQYTVNLHKCIRNTRPKIKTYPMQYAVTALHSAKNLARILLSDIQLGNIASSNAKCDGAIYPRSKVFWSTSTLYETSMLCLSLLLGLHLD